MTMNYRMFLAAVERRAYGIRRGQEMFNLLHDHSPEYADTIRGGPADPYYHDARIPEFLALLSGDGVFTFGGAPKEAP